MRAASPKPAAGFTLIEVLIALSILMLVVTTGFMAFQTTLSASERASNTTMMLTTVPYIQQHIRSELLASPLQTTGEGEMLGVAYSWQNNPGELTGPKADPTDIMATPIPARVRLHHIAITLNYQGQQRQFAYQELTWIPIP